MDPELAALAPYLPTLDHSDIAASRTVMGQVAAAARAAAEAVPPADGVTVTARTVTTDGASPAVPVRIYRDDATVPRPVLLYLHGGAFVLGEVALFDGICRAFVTGAGVTVVSVDYRLAPEHRYPAAVDDCYTALEWVARLGPSELGIDPDLIAVGGLSAGGGLAAALALMTRDRNGPRLAYQMLLNPVLDDRLETHSVRTLTDVPLWTSRDVAIMWDNYLGPDRSVVEPYAAPARAEDLSGLPPAFVQTSDLDPLRDEGILYALRLLQAGVPVDLHNIAGTFHSFDGFPVEIATSTVALQHAALRRAFRNHQREPR